MSKKDIFYLMSNRDIFHLMSNRDIFYLMSNRDIFHLMSNRDISYLMSNRERIKNAVNLIPELPDFASSQFPLQLPSPAKNNQTFSPSA